MRHYPILMALPLCALMASVAEARPVSYPGGWTLMQMNDGYSHSLHVHYSPTAKDSIGYKAEYWRGEDWQFHGLQYNRLVKRWNEKSSQANLYFKSGLGVAYSDYGRFDGETNPAGFAGIAADWEDRDYFTSYENKYVNAGNIDRFFQQTARVGFTPYVGDYGDLHTWLMLQVTHMPEDPEDHFVVTPMVRFFKGVTLVEAGISHRGDVMFNTVYRF